VGRLLAEIQKYLAGHPWQDKIIWLDTIDSTNTYAKELARNGAPEGTVVIADHQTGGRGRMGRSFTSPAGMGIYMSIILRPECFPEELMHLTCAAGLAASNAVSDVTDRVPGIKWTNDLILARRKLGGILTELSVDPQTRKVEWAIIGIGINCCQEETDFPEEIRPIAISLHISPAKRLQLIAAIIRTFHQMRPYLFTEKDGIMEDFRHRCVTLGQDISILRGDEVRHGKAVDVDNDGGLVVAFSDGHLETVTSGEVSIRGMYGYV
jgi:BirA family biotin operon repressor/biotin-[acetyl-CoA-carboxylase] ligase